MVIDAHVHYTPPKLKEALTTMGEPYWSLLLASPQSIQGWVSAETMLADMDAAGVDQVVFVGEYFQQHENCVRRNDQMIELVNRYPERMRAMAIVSPNAGDAAVQELRRCLDAGLEGLGEVNPYAQSFNLDDRHFLKLVDVCAEYDAPINLHVGEEVGGYYLGKSTVPLREYYQLAVNRPNAKLIFAHWGGGLLFYEIMPRVRRQMANVVYDTAASPLLYPTKRIVQTALTCLEPHKIVYGSDYPLKIYPSKQTQPDFTRFLAALRKQLPAELHGAVLGENAASVFTKQDAPAPVAAEADETAALTGTMSVRTAVDVWPETADVFGRYNIPTRDSALPVWEPITQAAAARGLSERQQQTLLAELDEEIGRLP